MSSHKTNVKSTTLMQNQCQITKTMSSHKTNVKWSIMDQKQAMSEARVKIMVLCTDTPPFSLPVMARFKWLCRFTSTGEVALQPMPCFSVVMTGIIWPQCCCRVGHSRQSDLDADVLTLNHVWWWVVGCHTVVHKCGVSVPCSLTWSFKNYISIEIAWSWMP